MKHKAWSVILYLLIDFAASSDWIVIQPSLPSVTDKHPDSFNLNLGWSEEDKSQTSKVKLHLKKSQAVDEQILYFTNDDNGKPSLTSLIDMKHTVFYQDLKNYASISLTNFSGKVFALQGSFLFNDESYEIEPYHPKVHKRSLGARDGDHVVRKRSTGNSNYRSDYLEPVPGSQDYDRVQRAQTAFRELQDEEKAGRKKRSANDYVLPEEGSEDAERMKQSRDHLEELLNRDGERKKRNTLPQTTYTVELYIAVDYYLYLKLKDSAERLDWARGVDDYISFFIAHQANEIDIRYRMIDSGIHPVHGQWTMSTKLSYLNVAKTGSGSPWTYPPDLLMPTLVEADDCLDRWTQWVGTSILPQADHFMLITGLNLTLEGNINIDGIAHIGGICGENRTSFMQLTTSDVHAHELGHNLGSYHDGTYDSCHGEDQYVMAAIIEYPTNSTIGHRWIFSSCSVEYFDSFLKVLNSDFFNCLLGAGAYIPKWEDSLSGHLGQDIPVDEQCMLFQGKDNYYARDQFDTVCSQLSCTNGDGFMSIDPNRETLQHTSCGNKKWCEKSICVYHPDAPALDEGCPFEDKDFPQWNVNCSEVTPWQCQKSPFLQLYCCKACRVFATPWLGPNCTHGDTGESFCENLVNTTGCLYEAEYCCESCCPILGPEEGYSCIQPPPTTTTTTTSTSTTTVISTTMTSTPTHHKESETNLMNQARGPILERLSRQMQPFAGDGAVEVTAWLSQYERLCELEHIAPCTLIAYMLDGTAARVHGRMRVGEAS
ncbi:A disintegrin and metalloproteinase with thrombospondin motifs 16-like [Watersipora subatra]|uniref:A disintegrin and metalloproteinase with thrombospondin motifs 16-like n=1 Tax=Watersipora subatra TaxID=2589382 RepID=UPI00355BEB31